MDEQHTAADVVDVIGTKPLPHSRSFDPADLLAGRQPPPLPYVAGPTVEVVEPFDPAVFLGARALRGAFNLATVKPLVSTIGGVEMVTVPSSAYAHALRRVLPQELPLEHVQQAGPVPDVEGCMGLLIQLHEAGALSGGQLAQASGLDHPDIEARIASYRAMLIQHAAVNATLHEVDEASPVRFVRSPEDARVDLGEAAAASALTALDPDMRDAPVSEDHGAALDDGRQTEAHGAATVEAKPLRHSRKAKAIREVP